MPLYDFRCEGCDHCFESILSSADADWPECPRCSNKGVVRLPSLFKVGGRGDLRESTLHGCHDHYDGVSDHHDHSHGSHDHDDD